MADPTETEDVEAAPESDQERNWRKLEGRAKTAEERVAQLEREMAFTKAGLSHLSDKQVKALSAAHEGDITADALKATAEELGFGAKTEAGESTPASEQPDHSAEATELANLARSPAGELSKPLDVRQVEEGLAKAAAEGPQAAMAYMESHKDWFDY